MSEVEAKLDHKRQQEHMKKELDDQKPKVHDMNGKKILPMKTSDIRVNTKIKYVSKVKSSSGAKPKTAETISKLKAPASATDVDNKTSSETEEVTIDTLWQNTKLQKQVQKELSKFFFE